MKGTLRIDNSANVVAPALVIQTSVSATFSIKFSS